MNIGIIGAGASGLMAAITAAKQGAKVTLIDKKDRIGKKILATGNGKCNFTNKEMSSSDYRSQNKNVFSDYVSQFNETDTISWFQGMGMLIKEKNGYCYPRSEQAATVLDILRIGIEHYKVQVLAERYPVSIEKRNHKFEVILDDNQKIFFDHVILSCGSFAGEKETGKYNGYSYAKAFGHTIVPVVPALVQLRAKEDFFKAISGVRCEARVSLYIEQKFITEESGELQLTDYGISGIPVFQLSRYVSYGVYEKKSVKAVIDFFPDYEYENLYSFIKNKWEKNPKDMTAETFFQGLLNKKLNLMFLKRQKVKAATPLKQIPFSKIADVIKSMKSLEIEIEGTNPYVNAQICAGGVSMEEVTLQLESKFVSGLYFAGELLDVDGRCGGYNLQWAWTSGYLAGKAAADKKGKEK